MERIWDVIVVGGGPAGAAAALEIAKQGFEVTLLDRAIFPRDKACGEFLTPVAYRLLVDMGLKETLAEVGVRPVRSTQLIAGDGSVAEYVPENGKPVGYSLRRSLLDAELFYAARKAGVNALDGIKVQRVGDMQNGTRLISCRTAENLDLNFRARLVVGADGAHSVVARQCGLVNPIKRLQRIALVTHWKDVGGANDTIEMRASGQIVCGLSFPGPGLAANLTLVAPISAAPDIAGRARDWIWDTLATSFPDVFRRLDGAQVEPDIRSIGCFGHVSKPAVADGVCLVGDAATFIDPITGEGVFFALRGAQIAAEAVGKALRAGDVGRRSLLPYCKARKELARRYLLCDLVQFIARSPGLMHHVVRQLQRFPGAAERLLTILGGERSPFEALHPAFLWNLIAPEL